MRKAGFAVLLFVSLSFGQQTAAPSQEPMATRQDIVNMFDAMHIKQQMADVMQSVQQNMNAMFDNIFDSVSKQNHVTFTPEERQRMREQALKFAKKAQDAYPVSEMLDDMIPVYQKHLTHADALAVLAFYQSPAGQHMVKEGPAMSKEGMALVMPKMQQRLQPIMEEMMTETTALAQEMAKKHTSAQ